MRSEILSKQEILFKEVDVSPIPLLPGDVVFEWRIQRIHIVTHMMSSCIAQTISFSQHEGWKTRGLLSPRPHTDTVIYVER
jgi:hypothetical protein